MSEDERIREKVLAVNMLKDYSYTPKNVVLVTIDDVVEIVREVAPYAMSKLDEQKERESRLVREAKTMGGLIALTDLLDDNTLWVHAKFNETPSGGYTLEEAIPAIKLEGVRRKYIRELKELEAAVSKPTRMAQIEADSDHWGEVKR